MPDKDTCEHEVDWSTLEVGREFESIERPDEPYLDVKCKKCGTSGCIAGPTKLRQLAKTASW